MAPHMYSSGGTMPHNGSCMTVTLQLGGGGGGGGGAWHDFAWCPTAVMAPPMVAAILQGAFSPNFAWRPTAGICTYMKQL